MHVFAKNGCYTCMENVLSPFHCFIRIFAEKFKCVLYEYILTKYASLMLLRKQNTRQVH